MNSVPADATKAPYGVDNRRIRPPVGRLLSVTGASGARGKLKASDAKASPGGKQSVLGCLMRCHEGSFVWWKMILNAFPISRVGSQICHLPFWAELCYTNLVCAYTKRTRTRRSQDRPPLHRRRTPMVTVSNVSLTFGGQKLFAGADQIGRAHV